MHKIETKAQFNLVPMESNIMYAGLEISGRHISKMYWRVINGRTGIG